MSARTEWSSPVRVSELGKGGHVHPQRILEWLQDAAANASVRGGFTPERYRQMGAAWFIREFMLQLEAPLRYGETFTVETWVSDLRRFRTRREYVVRVGAEARARGQADWLYLERDKVSGKIRPRHPDEEMKAAFPREAATALSPEAVLPWRDADPTGAIETRRVTPSEIDDHDHVNHTYYLRWLEDHAQQLYRGTTLTAIRMEYLADSKDGDDLELRTVEHETGYTQWIHRADTLVMRAESRRRA